MEAKDIGSSVGASGNSVEDIRPKKKKFTLRPLMVEPNWFWKGLLGRAIDVLEKMPKHGCTPNSLSYNPLLLGFCKEKKMDRAIEYLEIMVSRGCHPDIVTYNTLLTALCKDGKADFAVDSWPAKQQRFVSCSNHLQYSD